MQLTQFRDINIKCVIRAARGKEMMVMVTVMNERMKRKYDVIDDAILFVEGVCGSACHFKLSL